jgi:hypothetical protein
MQNYLPQVPINFQQNNSVEYLKNKLPAAEAQPLVIWKKVGIELKLL